jgi:hypothetical protein
MGYRLEGGREVKEGDMEKGEVEEQKRGGERRANR